METRQERFEVAHDPGPRTDRTLPRYRKPHGNDVHNRQKLSYSYPFPSYRQRERVGLSLTVGSSMNFPTTARIQRIRQKSTESMTAIASAGTHLVVQGTNKINGI
jgi:hypothetical protein